jgi:cold shock CspA family protein
MLIGIIKWFEPSKGYGVIVTPDNVNYFLHVDEFNGNYNTLSKGKAVVYHSKTTNAGKENAIKCRLAEKFEDWKLALSYLGKDDRVLIESDAAVAGRGNHYNQRNSKPVSLMEVVSLQVFKTKSPNEIADIIIRYFDKELDLPSFTNYCRFLEKLITQSFPGESADTLLKKVITYFGSHLEVEMLFQVWKSKEFRFIDYEEGEYEIPLNVLNSYIDEIAIPELMRIQNYSFAEEFISQFVKNKFSQLQSLSPTELSELYPLIQFIKVDHKQEYKLSLDEVIAQKATKDIIESLSKLGQINNSEEVTKVRKWMQSIPDHLKEIEIIKSKISLYLDENSSEEFKTELWIEGFVPEPVYETILKKFTQGDSLDPLRFSILLNIPIEKQVLLFNEIGKIYGTEQGFLLLERFVRNQNELTYDFKLHKVLFEDEFWNGKLHKELVDGFTKNAELNLRGEEKLDLFLKGFLRELPDEIVLANVEKLDRDSCRIIFKNKSSNKRFIRNVLEQMVDFNKNYSGIYDTAKDFLDEKTFQDFDQKVFEKIEEASYFELWLNGKGRILPVQYIGEFLHDKIESYEEAEKWIKQGKITSTEISKILFSYLRNQIEVTNRPIFYKQFYHIQFLIRNDENLDEIKGFKNLFYKLALWYLDKEDKLDFKFLQTKFIYFAPDAQVRVIRKLFNLKATGKLDLTIEKLSDLTRFDINLYKTSLELIPEIPIDVSTDVVIKALSHFKQNGRFLIENELLAVILEDLQANKAQRFRLSNYFEKCLGRETAKYDWSREGEIKKVPFNNNQSYFAISFSMGETNTVRQGYRQREVFVPNPNFDLLKEKVKELPGARWNPTEKHWGVDSRYESEVLAFGRENRFFFDFGGNNYSNNIHLAKFARQDIPNGIVFCEGRLSNIPDRSFNKQFWWCAGKPCFNKCETLHSSNNWEQYTLLDFCEILGLNIDETNRMQDHIPKGHYYQFIALINRFNRLLQKLYCKDCNQILHSVDTGHFAAHTIVRFHCVNSNCNNKEEVYLNHCFNGQCNNFIDSRVSKQCKNGLYICEKCGSCCSHKMQTNRLSNLQANGGFIHSNLRKCVEEKLGHLERAEYYCYHCAGEMNEHPTDIYHCNACNITYDTTKYKFERPHRHLRTQIRQGPRLDDNDIIPDLPF